METEEFLDDFMNAVRTDLARAQNKKGDLWLSLPKEGQEVRIKRFIAEYFDRFEQEGKRVPWESIAGYALIGWIRESHPELFP